MTTAPPITHAIHRAVTRRPCGLGFIYTASCECGTTWQPTVDRDEREVAVRRHMEQVKRIEIKAAEMERKRVLAAGQRQRAKARKAAAASTNTT